MPSLTIDLKPNSPLHKMLLEKVRDRIEFSKTRMKDKHEQWQKAEKAAVAYMPEKNVDTLRRMERENSGVPQYTTVCIPYTYGVLMAAHTYWTTVFMSRSPVMQFAGRHGEAEQQVQAVEALLDYQLQVGGWLVPLYIWLLDVGKYGLGVTSEYWCEEFSTVSEIVEEEVTIAGVLKTGKMRKKKLVRQIPGYSGNKLFNVRPFDFFPDPRVPLHNFQTGEFCGRYVELGWNEVIRRKSRGYYQNTELLGKDGNDGGGGREAGSAQVDTLDTNNIFGRDIHRQKANLVLKLYETAIELVPSDWNLGAGMSPEKWVFTCTSDFKVMLGAQPMGSYHDKFPFNVLQMEPEGYGLTGRGMPEILDPVQRTMDWLLNTHFYNVRKTINNQFLMDPSRIVMKDVLNPGAGGVIRAKPAAYGSDLRMAMHQLQVTDITRNHLTDLAQMNDIGQRVSGVNDQILGMLAPGSSRKSATEIRTSSTFGTNRLKTTAEYFSAMGWSPMCQKLVQNTQQYYSQERKFRIVGDLAQQAGTAFMQVSPDAIQGFYDFVPVDGTLPVDRYAQANLWNTLLGQLRNFPEIMQQYDIGKIFGWVAQLAGLKNINQFKVQIMPNALLAQQAASGNVVPMTRENADLTRVPEPGQNPGMGATG